MVGEGTCPRGDRPGRQRYGGEGGRAACLHVEDCRHLLAVPGARHDSGGPRGGVIGDGNEHGAQASAAVGPVEAQVHHLPVGRP